MRTRYNTHSHSDTVQYTQPCRHGTLHPVGRGGGDLHAAACTRYTIIIPGYDHAVNLNTAAVTWAQYTLHKAMDTAGDRHTNTTACTHSTKVNDQCG